jgi:hypothetical protein
VRLKRCSARAENEVKERIEKERGCTGKKKKIMLKSQQERPVNKEEKSKTWGQNRKKKEKEWA